MTAMAPSPTAEATRLAVEHLGYVQIDTIKQVNHFAGNLAKVCRVTN